MENISLYQVINVEKEIANLIESLKYSKFISETNKERIANTIEGWLKTLEINFVNTSDNTPNVLVCCVHKSPEVPGGDFDIVLNEDSDKVAYDKSEKTWKVYSDEMEDWIEVQPPKCWFYPPMSMRDNRQKELESMSKEELISMVISLENRGQN